MAKSRKTKTKSATKAKSAAKKSKGRKGRTGKKQIKALTRGIGVISTISMTRELRTAFEKGVNDSTVVFKYKHLSSYKDVKLGKKFKKFNKDTDIGMIVSVGGLKAYNAAAKYAKK